MNDSTAVVHTGAISVDFERRKGRIMEELVSRDVNCTYIYGWTCRVAVNLVAVTIQVDCASRLTDI